MSPTPNTDPTLGSPPKLSWSESVLARLMRVNARLTDPIYLMIYPPLDVAWQMRQLGLDSCRKFNLTRDPHAANRLHVTLFFPCVCGELTCENLDAIADVLANLSMPRFALGVERLMNCRGEEQKLVLAGGEGVDGAIMLRNELVPEMHWIGFRDKQRNCNPHVTLDYQHCHIQEEAIEIIRWTVKEIFLVCSLQ